MDYAYDLIKYLLTFYATLVNFSPDRCGGGLFYLITFQYFYHECRDQKHQKCGTPRTFG
jgi:hypothetical protein